MIELVFFVFLYVAASYFWITMEITDKYPTLKDGLFDKVISFPMALIGRLL